jgi:hypothetical protein
MWEKIIRVLKIVLLIIILLILYSCEGEIYSPWEIIKSPVDNALYTIYALDKNNIFATGYIESFIRYNGNEWFKLEPPKLNYEYKGVVFQDMFFNNENDGWAVGSGILENTGVRGIIVHWNGDKWEDVTPEPYTDVYPLMCVFFPTPDEGWAGSEGGRIYHYINGEWSLQGEFPANLYSIWFNSPTDGWMGGDPECLLHWNGYFWQIYYYNPGATNCGYFDICFPDSDYGWVLWFSYLQGYLISAIFHYTKDEGWKLDTPDFIVQGGFNAISFSNYNDGWLVGGKWSYHWDGNTWTEVPVPTLYDKAGLNDVFAISPDDVWAVGDWGTILHFTGFK